MSVQDSNRFPVERSSESVGPEDLDEVVRTVMVLEGPSVDTGKIVIGERAKERILTPLAVHLHEVDVVDPAGAQ